MGLTQKGTIATGMDADLVIFDPARSKIISCQGDAPTLHEASEWTPYEGMRVDGWVRSVLFRGGVIVRNEEYTGRGDEGRFVARKPIG
jgi:dihydropyrimidinase